MFQEGIKACSLLFQQHLLFPPWQILHTLMLRGLKRATPELRSTFSRRSVVLSLLDNSGFYVETLFKIYYFLESKRKACFGSVSQK